MFDRRVAAADNAHPIDAAHPVKCPGENTRARRESSMAGGVNVDESVWAEIKKLAV
jgi:LDH2 family malate/lactate/ureidoglycolate dehydrogenase